MSKFSRGHIKAARLTPQQVLEIRRRYAEEGASQGSLARDFQISVVQIGRIVRGEAWQRFQRPISDDEIAESEALSHEAPPLYELPPELIERLSKPALPPEPSVPQDGDAVDRFLARRRAPKEGGDDSNSGSSGNAAA